MEILKIKNLFNDKSLKFGEILKLFHQPVPLEQGEFAEVKYKLQMG